MAVSSYALTSLASLKESLGIATTTDDTLLERCIDAATAGIESWCDRKFKARDFREFVQPNGGRTVRLEQYPVNSIDSIAYGAAISFSVESTTSATDVLASVGWDGSTLRLRKIASDGTSTTNSIDASSSYQTTSLLVDAINLVSGWSATLTKSVWTPSLYRFAGRGVTSAPCFFEYPQDDVGEYRVDFEMGLIHLVVDRFPVIRADDAPNNRFPQGFYPVFVAYNAGMSTIPDDLEDACIQIAGGLYHQAAQDPTVASEALGDYNYSRRAMAETLERHAHLLDGYREVR